MKIIRTNNPRFFFTLLALVVGAELLSSCSMLPDFEQPPAPVASSWISGEKQEQEVDKEKLASSIPWREFFKSQALQEVISTALENNQDLRIAALNIKKAQAQYRIQRSPQFPSVNVAADGTFKGQPEKETGYDSYYNYELYEVGLATASWEVDLFGRINSLSKAALNTYLGTEEAKKSLAISLIAQTANAYLQLVSDQENYELAKETLETRKKTHDIVSSSFANGVASKLDVAQARSAMENARASQIRYSRLVQQDKNALYLLLGVPSTTPLPAASDLDAVALLQDIPVGLPSQVLLQRPDIRKAEFAIRTANGNIGAARANFFPKITLTGSAGFASQEMGDLFSSDASVAWTLLPSIQLPIFTAGKNKATLESAKVQQEITVAQYEQAIQKAFSEVADELAARDTLTLQLEAQNHLVQASQDAYDLSYKLYRQGIDSFLNVLDSQRSLFTAQQAEIEVKRKHLANQINLYKVLGGGVTVSTEDKTEQGSAVL